MKILRRLLTVLAALVLFGVLCAAGLIGFVYDKETHLPPVGDFDTIMVLGAHYLGRYYPALTIVLRVMSVAVIIYLVNKSGSATTKITWIILVMALPAFGVYACYLETSGGIFPAVVNVGRHPTLPEGHVTVEAHVLDEFLSLYGRNVRLTFLKFMRPEQKFDSIETLRAQIAHDADDCRAYFAQLQ